MSRLHMHVNVDDLDKAKSFYAALFNASPCVEKHDYAKWMLEDPKVNFAISKSGGMSTGVNHVGLQVDSSEELDELQQRLEKERIESAEEKGAKCCYMLSDKHWTKDPDGVHWELFHSHSEETEYGDDSAPLVGPSNCCG